jgi:hypothetical protein
MNVCGLKQNALGSQGLQFLVQVLALLLHIRVLRSNLQID